MPDGGHHSLTRKAIKRPTQDDVKPTLVRIVKHSREFGPLILAFGAADAIDILVDNLVPSTGAPLSQLKQLVVGVLIMAASAFLVAVPVLSIRADPGVYRYTHSSIRIQ